MDLFKNIKDLKTYGEEIKELFCSITMNGTKVKIGKFKIIDTPCVEAAERLFIKISLAVESEMMEIKSMYDKIEDALEEIQTDLFKSRKDATIKLESKVN